VVNEANADPAPAVVPAEQLQATGSAFERDIRFLRGRGCHCMLSWNGSIAGPHTICEETGKSGLCPKRMILQESTECGAS